MLFDHVERENSHDPKKRRLLAFLIILRLRPIMLPIQLRPFRKLVLRTRGIQFSLQLEDFSCELALGLNVGGGGGGEFIVESP